MRFLKFNGQPVIGAMCSNHKGIDLKGASKFVHAGVAATPPDAVA